MTIQIVTGANAGYMDKIKPYLETLRENAAPADPYLVGVNCRPAEEIINTVSTFDTSGSPAGTQSLQHGGWLNAVPGKPEDVVIFTDGDIFMQRKFSEQELQALNEWPGGALGVSYNMGPYETLLHEALFKLNPKVSDAEFLARWGRSTLEHLCFNVGVMVARRETYQRLYDLYMPLWDEIGVYLEHQARQQWLISYLIGTQFKSGILDYSVHTHAHFQLPPGVLIAKDGTAYYNNQEILFWHLPMWARKHV